jgi:hypothetical protein
MKFSKSIVVIALLTAMSLAHAGNCYSNKKKQQEE